MSTLATEAGHVFQHGMADLGDVKLHYVRGGRGKLALLLHGWPQTWYSWRRVMPSLVDAGYEVLAVDMRGIGDSSRPLTGYDSRTVAGDLHRLVQRLGLGPAHVVGHDNGGRIAYAYAAEFRDETDSLTFLESKAHGVADPEDFLREYWHFGLHCATDLAEALTAGNERTYLSWFYKTYSHDHTWATEEEIDEYVRCYSSLGGMRAGFEYYRAFPDSGKQNREWARQKLTVPVLAFGDSDVMGSIPIESMRLVAENVSGGIIENCGHWIPDEKPEFLSKELIHFFAQADQQR
ncbi:alpha/beta fold hydrolase [Streptomyces sp. Tue6028]|uniref:alpha/beta fold hydrolase n=1 Tax=Streptomyces sp. Tue6028 TaxID=2036037 RepID=UPI003D761459